LETVFFIRRRWDDTIKMGLTEIRLEGVDWIHVAQDRYQWRAVVKMVMNHLVKRCVISWLAKRLLFSQGELCSMELDYELFNICRI
jgi:hypothetical protein